MFDLSWPLTTLYMHLKWMQVISLTICKLLDYWCTNGLIGNEGDLESLSRLILALWQLEC